MTFTTGFVGGVTLTYSLLYLGLHMHRHNRMQQHLMLKQQTLLLNSFFDSPSQSTTSSTPATTSQQLTTPTSSITPFSLSLTSPLGSNILTYERRRDGRPTFLTSLKTAWNDEVENVVRRVQDTDWDGIRERWEDKGGRVWRGLVQRKE